MEDKQISRPNILKPSRPQQINKQQVEKPVQNSAQAKDINEDAVKKLLADQEAREKAVKLEEEALYYVDKNKQWPPYTKEDFNREVFGQDVNHLLAVLSYKKNIILQGSPGVGKTYTAKRLAFAMMGCKDEDRVTGLQFHQNYQYDDFIEGLRPTLDGGFRIVKGPFYIICEKAIRDPNRPYFIIIDEINRGNMSKILGEMFSLIELDHRGEYMTLKFGDKFTVPPNLHIIGTMNTADRGLVMLDYALRRRFSFLTVVPAFKSAGFRALLANADNVKFNRICKLIIDLNKEIDVDEMLGPGFEIGNSYFCIRRKVTDEDLCRIIDYEIMPLLEEYWYDAPEKAERWKMKFEKVLQREQNII